MTVQQVVDELGKLWPISSKPTNIVISGGEPLLQQPALERLLRILDFELECPVQIETAGTIAPTQRLDEWVDQYNVSPKLASSGNTLSKRRKGNVLTWFTNCEKAWFKFVCTDEVDLEEVSDIVEEFRINSGRVMIMPEGTTESAILDNAGRIVDSTLKLGFGFTLRNHILVYGNKRGT